MEELNYVLFGKTQGCGYIQNDKNVINSRLIHKEFVINNQKLIPGQYTNLHSFFTREIRYLGVLNKDDQNEMIFFLGEHENKLYYESVHFISNTRIFIMYGPKSGRDFNFINNRWK